MIRVRDMKKRKSFGNIYIVLFWGHAWQWLGLIPNLTQMVIDSKISDQTGVRCRQGKRLYPLNYIFSHFLEAVYRPEIHNV